MTGADGPCPRRGKPRPSSGDVPGMLPRAAFPGLTPLRTPRTTAPGKNRRTPLIFGGSTTVTSMRSLWKELGIPAGPSSVKVTAAPPVDEQNKEKNVQEGEKLFGSGGAKFNELKGAKDLNPRQKKIFDDKLKQAIAKDPRAKSGTMTEAELKELAQKAAEVTDKLS